MTTNSQKPKAVIWFHAARPCLGQAIELLYKNFNNEYKYPVLVTTFGKQYSKNFINKIHKDIDPEIKFIELSKPEIPAHIKEEELFYNRKDNPYVRKSFPKSRIGYLHTNHFVAGEVQQLPKMQKYDYVLKMDDDTFFVDKVDFDIFKFMEDGGIKFASSTLKKYDAERQRNCQTGLRELVKEYIKTKNIKPVATGALNKNGDWDSVCPYDPSVWDLNIFRNENWKEWWKCIDESGGIYKYRWGDLEIHALYLRMYYPKIAWHNFDFYEKKIIKHGKLGFVHDRPKKYNFLFFIVRKLRSIFRK